MARLKKAAKAHPNRNGFAVLADFIMTGKSKSETPKEGIVCELCKRADVQATRVVNDTYVCDSAVCATKAKRAAWLE